jgi:homoserine O-acetyltransferase/O-succinyltransferase
LESSNVTETIPPPERLPGKRVTLGAGRPMPLDNGGALGPFEVAYETWGELNRDRTNAVLICHALTGDQYVIGTNPVTGKPGWWERMIGPGKPIDPDRYFVICSNIIGGCMGSHGPTDIDPATGQPYGLTFPVITIADMVRAQALLIEALGIEKLFCVVGGSMGGMQVLEWAASYPDKVFCAIPIATAPRHSAQNIAFNEVGRQAIMADPDWRGGAYQREGTLPRRGLAVARMAAHITYMSEAALHRKFGRSLQNRLEFAYGFDAEFQVESYLRHQGEAFVERFDANSYLIVTRALDYFDLAADHGDGHLTNVYRRGGQGTPVRFCVVSFSSDWLFPTAESRQVVQSLNAVAANVSFVEVETDKGHDAFLLDEPAFYQVIRGFIDGCAEHAGLSRPSPARLPAAATEGAAARSSDIRVDLRLIADLVEPGSRVLDIGCADGSLLRYLGATKNVDGRGIELSMDGVRSCVARGLSVVQGDAETDLADYPDEAFDYVILSQTIQAMRNPRSVLETMTRIGRRAIVSFPNFGYWRVRLQLLTKGRMPMTEQLWYPWWESPNIHLCTIGDFHELAHSLGLAVDHCATLDRAGRRTGSGRGALANLLGEQAIFLLRRK